VIHGTVVKLAPQSDEPVITDAVHAATATEGLVQKSFVAGPEIANGALMLVARVIVYSVA